MDDDDDDEWFSPEALRKQRVVRRLEAAGKQVPFDLMIGILEPRIPPTPEECCTHCGCDARDIVGGEVYDGCRWCAICFGRSRHLNSDNTTFDADTQCPRCGGDVADNWFDHEVCPPPCSTMHTRCQRCGCAINGCQHDTGRLRRDGM